MNIKLNSLRDYRKASCWLFCVILIGLAACSTPQDLTPQATPTASVISTDNLAGLSPEQTIGSGNAEAAAWSPDGKTLAIATSLQIDLYDSKTMVLTATLDGADQWNSSLAFSQDGKLLAASTQEGTTQVWDISQRHILQTLNNKGLQYGPNPTLIFSPDDKKLFVGADQTIDIWDLSNGQMLDSFPGQMDGIVDLDISKDGKLLLVAGSTSVSVRDLTTRQLLYQPVTQKGEFAAVFLALDGKHFETVNYINDLNLNSSGGLNYHSNTSDWDLATGKLISEYDTTPDIIYDVALSASQLRMATAGWNGFSVWDTNKKISLFSTGAGKRVSSIAISPDGKDLISIGGAGVQLWDVDKHKVLKSFDEYNASASAAAFSPDGRLVAVIGNNRRVQLRSVSDDKLLYTFDGSFPLTFSPNGSLLAFAQGPQQEIPMDEYSSNTSIALVDTRTGKTLPVEIPCSSASAIAISPDGQQIAYGGAYCPLQLRDLHSGKILQTLGEKGYLDPISLAFGPDGRTLIDQGYSTIRIWDLQNASVLKTIDGLQYDAHIAVSPDGRFLAISAFKGTRNYSTVQLWDLASYQHVFSMDTLRDTIQSLAFNPLGDVLAISGEDYDQEHAQLEFWNSWTGKPISSVDLSSKAAVDLAFSPDGKSFLSVENNGAIRNWKTHSPTGLASTNRSAPTLAPTQRATISAPTITMASIAELGKGFSSRVFRSADGKLAARFEGSVMKWYKAAGMTEIGSIDTGDNLYSHVTFSPNDKMIVVDSFYGAKIVDLASKSIIGSVSGGNGVTAGYTFTRDGRYMAYLMEDHTTGGPYHAIGLWNVAQRKDAFTDSDYFPTLLSGRYHTMSFPAISPDGNLVAAGHSDHHVYVWDLHSGQTRFVLDGHAETVTSVDFSPDGQFLASGSMDGTIRLWSPASGKLVRVLTGFSQDIDTLRFSQDGRSLIVNTVGSQPTQIYDLQTNSITTVAIAQPTTDPFELQQYQQGYTQEYINDVLFSPDGRTVALTGQGVWLWDAHTAKLLRYIDATQWGGLQRMAFSPDGKQLAITTYTAMLVILDSQSGQPALTLQGNSIAGQLVYTLLTTGSNPSVIEEPILAKGLAFSPSEAFVAFGNAADIEIWDAQKASQVRSLKNNQADAYVNQLSFSRDGKELFAILDMKNSKSLQAWDMETGVLRHKIDLPDPTGYVFSASILHAPLYARNNSDDTGSWVELWNIETGQSFKLNTPSGQTEPLVFSPDGNILLAANDSEFYFWKTSTGTLIDKAKTDFSSAQLDISPDNKTLAIAHDDKGELLDISQIALAAQASQAASGIPAAIATPAVIAWPTATPQATPSPDTNSSPSSKNAIDPANAGQVKELSRFGEGTIEQANWSPSGGSIVVAGSLGTFQYDASLAETAHLETDELTYRTVSLPDGTVLAASVNAGHVRVRDVTNAKILADLEGGGEPALSPDGTLLVYQDKDKNLQVWDIDSQKVVSTLYRDSDYSSYYPRWPEFSPNGKLVAAIQSNDGRLGYASAVRIWDAHSGIIVNALGGPDNDITDLSFSTDGHFIVGAAGGSAWIWQTQPGAPVDSINLYKGTVNGNLTIYDHTVTAAGISPDDQTIAVGTSERVIWLYDRQNHSVLHKFEGDSASLQHLSFSPDGKSLLAVDKDGIMQIWDIVSGKVLGNSATHTGPIGGLVFRTDGNLIAWGAGSAWVIQAVDGKLLQTTRVHGGTILAASPTADSLAVYDPFQVSLWDARSGKFRQTLEGEAEDPFVDYQYEGLVFRQFSSAAFSVDGSRLATAGTGGIWVYNLPDGKLIQQFPGTNASKLAFSPDNRWLLASTYEQINPPEIFDVESGTSIFSLPDSNRGSDFLQYAFSPDRRFVGAVKLNWEEPNELVLYDTASKQVFKHSSFGKDIEPTSLAFSPATSLVAVGQADGQIALVDLSNLSVIATLTGNYGEVQHLAFSEDGRYLASGSSDGTVRIWGLP